MRIRKVPLNLKLWFAVLSLAPTDVAPHDSQYGSVDDRIGGEIVFGLLTSSGNGFLPLI